MMLRSVMLRAQHAIIFHVAVTPMIASFHYAATAAMRGIRHYYAGVASRYAMRAPSCLYARHMLRARYALIRFFDD